MPRHRLDPNSLGNDGLPLRSPLNLTICRDVFKLLQAVAVAGTETDSLLRLTNKAGPLRQTRGVMQDTGDVGGQAVRPVGGGKQCGYRKVETPKSGRSRRQRMTMRQRGQILTGIPVPP